MTSIKPRIDADFADLRGIKLDGVPPQQAQLTFAMARHAVVDLSQIFDRPPVTPKVDRFSSEDLEQMRQILTAAGVSLLEGDQADQKLAELRRMYEPYVNALAQHLFISLPPWFMSKNRADNWQTSAWERISSRLDRRERRAESMYCEFFVDGVSRSSETVAQDKRQLC